MTEQQPENTDPSWNETSTVAKIYVFALLSLESSKALVRRAEREVANAVIAMQLDPYMENLSTISPAPDGENWSDGSNLMRHAIQAADLLALEAIEDACNSAVVALGGPASVGTVAWTDTPEVARDAVIAALLIHGLTAEQAGYDDRLKRMLATSAAEKAVSSLAGAAKLTGVISAPMLQMDMTGNDTKRAAVIAAADALSSLAP